MRDELGYHHTRLMVLRERKAALGAQGYDYAPGDLPASAVTQPILRLLLGYSSWLTPCCCAKGTVRYVVIDEWCFLY